MYDKLTKRLQDFAVELRKAEDALLVRDAADAIEELSKLALDEHNRAAVAAWEHRWIPVTERLPEEWWPVLGLIKFHEKEEPPAQQVLWYLGNGHWREVWRGDMIESDVTHWMPLPDPPKGG